MGSPSPVRLWKKYGLTISGPTMEEIWAHHLRSDYGRNMGSPSPVRLWKKYGLTISGPTMEEIWAHHLRSDYGRNMGSPSPVRLYRLSLVIVCYFLEPKAKKKIFLASKNFPCCGLSTLCDSLLFCLASPTISCLQSFLSWHSGSEHSLETC